MVVVDASVIYKWFAANEPNFLEAFALLQRHSDRKEHIVVPDIVLYELANAWATKTGLPAQAAKQNLKNLENIDIEIIPCNFELINKSIEFAKHHHVSVSDASYAVLAKEKKCKLITADQKFQKQVSLPFVALL